MSGDGCRLHEWINSIENLKVDDAPQATSTRSQIVIDLVVASYQLSLETTQIDQIMQVTNHYPVHWKITSSLQFSSIYEK
jgi:hypothetical protein